MTITCGIQPTGVVTMAMEVLHNTCNMCICDLPDMYALSPQAFGPLALGIHIRQIPHAHVRIFYDVGNIVNHIRVVYANTQSIEGVLASLPELYLRYLHKHQLKQQNW